MRINRRLNRPDIYLQLARMARKWKYLSYPRFVIQAESEMNPDKTNEPDDNFSVTESIRGWMQPKPLSFRIAISQDLRLYVDSLGRPDPYAKYYCNTSRLGWNKQAGHETKQILVVYYDVEEMHPATNRRPEYVIPVRHHYLRVLRGRYAVEQVDGHYQDGINGLHERSDTIQHCLNARSVDRAIEEVLAENQHIQNGY